MITDEVREGDRPLLALKTLKIGAPSSIPLARSGTHRIEPTARRYAETLRPKKLKVGAQTRFGSLRPGSERRSKPSRRSAFARLSPCNRRSSSDRVADSPRVVGMMFSFSVWVKHC